jgi:hypothetical protein
MQESLSKSPILYQRIQTWKIQRIFLGIFDASAEEAPRARVGVAHSKELKIQGAHYGVI